MKQPVKFSELDFAFGFVSSSDDSDAFLQKSTGRIFCRSEYGDLDELGEAGLGDGGWDDQDMIAIPDKRDLDLGQPLVFRFVRSRLPRELDRVRGFFSHRGAYAQFRDLLVRNELLEDWYEFEADAEKQARLSWCEENGVKVST